MKAAARRRLSTRSRPGSPATIGRVESGGGTRGADLRGGQSGESKEPFPTASPPPFARTSEWDIIQRPPGGIA